MTDLHESLDRLAQDQAFRPLDAATVIDSGGRALRRRRLVGAAAVSAVAVVVAVGIGVGVQQARTPSLEFGDPGDREPAPLPAKVQYTDLATWYAAGSKGPGVPSRGLGWPLRDMDPVSGPDGEAHFPVIDRLDAESMCLPMLEELVEGPLAWRHSEAWVDEFPSRATMPVRFEATEDGTTYTAICTLPGDYVPARRPAVERVPTPDDDAAILEHCSYVGRIDFSGWTVAAADQAAGRTIAALKSTNGYVATCSLGPDSRGMRVQLSRRTEPPTSGVTLLYDNVAGSVTMAGLAPAGAATVEMRVGGRPTVTAEVADGTYAIASPATGGDPTVRLTAYDDRGVEVASFSTTVPASEGPQLVPADCFYSLETGNDGC